MKEYVLAMCLLNPCMEIPNTDILLVPLPFHIMHPMIDVDDNGMDYCDECGFHIKWVHPARQA